MTLDHITQLINKHGTITAQPLLDLVVTVVLEAVEATERESRAEVERLTADVERLNALLDVATKMHDRLMDERNKLREDLAQTNAMFKQRER